MTKAISFTAAIILFAPLAAALVMQAARIVA